MAGNAGLGDAPFACFDGRRSGGWHEPSCPLGTSWSREPMIRIFLAAAVSLLGPVAAWAQQPQTIRVGWTIPAEEFEILDDAAPRPVPRSRQELQGRVDAVPGHRADGAGHGGGRARLLDPGRAVAGAGRDLGQPRDLHRRPARRREAGQLLGLLGREGRQPDQDHRRPQGEKRRHQRVRLRHPRADVHAA